MALRDCVVQVRDDTMAPPAFTTRKHARCALAHALLCALLAAANAACGPNPPVWPEQFVLVQRRIPNPDAAVALATTVTYYDFKYGANLIQITPDANASDILWDLELTTGHSFYFTPSRKTCKPMDFPVGILRPNWLANATLLGSNITMNGRTCVGWTKVDFIDYYADAETCQPVSWYFHTMRARFDTIYFREGAAPTTKIFIPPGYCPKNAIPSSTTSMLH